MKTGLAVLMGLTLAFSGLAQAAHHEEGKSKRPDMPVQSYEEQREEMKQQREDMREERKEQDQMYHEERKEEGEMYREDRKRDDEMHREKRSKGY
ncbi:hypothetical protein GCM10009104_29210 [Marinobacterium maritimum]|uniref:Uncharacterized protein n=1 Tax=Marinobacterium maritimum TaxID=500162 RepID=A0ABN1I958_9GAMM